MNAHNHRIHSLLAVLSLLLTSCGTVVYESHTVALPLISHRGEWQLDAAAGSGLAVTASYGVTDKVAAQLHLTRYAEGFHLQASPGVYWRVGQSAVVECYAGVGYSRSDDDYPDTPFPQSHFTNRFVLPFVQANAGRRNEYGTEVAFGLMVGGFFPNDVLGYYKIDEQTGVPYVASRERYDKPSLLVEPQVQFRFGRKRLRYTLRLSYAWLSGFKLLPLRPRTFTYSPFVISHGVSYTF